MSQLSRPDAPIVPHDNAPHAPVEGPQDAGDSTRPPLAMVAGRLTPPRRFLLCLDDDQDEDLPLIVTLPPAELGRIDPAVVYGCGLDTGEHALLSLRHSARGRTEMARCASAWSALRLFSRVHPLRLVYLDPA